VNLIVVGTNHRIAGVAIRERLAASVSLVSKWRHSRAGDSRISELLVLATCHRVELYAAVKDLRHAEEALLELAGSDAAGLVDGRLPRYVLAGEEAITHLCRVACGLDSVIVGEAEISGQVRRAASVARESGSLGPYLERVIAAALTASGRARAETDIGRGVLSAASAGVTLASSLIGSLADKEILVAGAGEAGRQVLARLARRRARRVLVSSRSERHALEAAANSGATVVGFDSLVETIRTVDVLFTTLQTPAFVLTAADVTSRVHRPLVAIDLSVPRAIDPAIARVGGVRLRTVDDLGDIARASLDRRAEAVPLVEAIARDESARAFVQFRSRAARTVTSGR